MNLLRWPSAARGLILAWSAAGVAVLSPVETRGVNTNVQEIIVVFKTHFDIGYTDLVTNVLTRYRTTFLDKALKLIEDSSTLERDRQFVWTVPGWPLRQMLWDSQTPERREKVVQALKRGRLAVHALPFTLQTESLDLEDLVRGLKFSADLARENGLPLPQGKALKIRNGSFKVDLPAFAPASFVLENQSAFNE